MMKGGDNNSFTNQLVPLYNFLKDQLKYKSIQIENMQDHIKIIYNGKIVTVWIWLGNFHIKYEVTEVTEVIKKYINIPITNTYKDLIDTIKGVLEL